MASPHLVGRENVRIRHLRDPVLYHSSTDIGETEIAALEAVCQSEMIQTKLMQHGGMQVVDVDPVFRRMPADFICRPVHLASPDASAGHQHAE